MAGAGSRGPWSMAAREGGQISMARKALAISAMAGGGGMIALEAVRGFGIHWMFVAFAVLLAAAGVGMTRRSLAPQVLSRGAAWIVFLPTLLVTVFTVIGGRTPDAAVAGLAVATGAALLLARPMLHTKEAKEAFAPRVFRRWLLAGSTATASTAFVAGGIALGVSDSHPATAVGFAAVAASLLASSVAVVRMRAWGIFLGVLTSLGLLVTGAIMGRDEAFLLGLGAAPALLLHLLPVLIARHASARDEAGSKLRVADVAEPAFAPARLRVASDVEELEIAPAAQDAPAATLRA